jgi:ABC-type bacteriocin/lantibiotic exporter with double-glycine peptidase domain
MKMTLETKMTIGLYIILWIFDVLALIAFWPVGVIGIILLIVFRPSKKENDEYKEKIDYLYAKEKARESNNEKGE